MDLQFSRRLRILDFDIENRPLSYLGMDFTTAEITAIGAQFTDEPAGYVWALGEDTAEDMLLGFKVLYDAADIVTGHYIKHHDLPIINGALLELGLPGLGAKLVTDTKVDLKIFKGISKSQESLGGMFGLIAPKVQMDQTKWRAANRLTPEGIALTKERVLGDVIQHMELRVALIEAGVLRTPEIWKP